MAKYKKGDLVRLVRDIGWDLAIGSTGTVSEDDSDCPWVTWDGFTGGCAGNRNDGSRTDIACSESDLELIADAPKTRDALAILVAIHLITQAQADAALALAEAR